MAPTTQQLCKCMFVVLAIELSARRTRKQRSEAMTGGGAIAGQTTAHATKSAAVQRPCLFVAP